MPSERTSDTRERILDTAERLLQARGFNGFSYGDVAGELGITRAALHYHHPGKAELGEALIARYTERASRLHWPHWTTPAPTRARRWPATPRSTPGCWPGTGCACAGCSPPST